MESNIGTNMGTTDRVIRLLAAAIIALLYFTGTLTGTFGIILLVLVGIFTLTSITGYCPLYAPFEISTNLKRQKKDLESS